MTFFLFFPPVPELSFPKSIRKVFLISKTYFSTLSHFTLSQYYQKPFSSRRWMDVPLDVAIQWTEMVTGMGAGKDHRKMVLRVRVMISYLSSPKERESKAMAWCWNLPPFWSMKSGQTLKVMVVTRTCLPPLAPMAAFSAAWAGFHQRFLAVGPSSGFCFNPIQCWSLSRSAPRGFMLVSIVSVLVWNRGIFRQFVSMRNQKVFNTEHVVLDWLTAVPSESSFQLDPSLQNTTKNNQKATLDKKRYLWSAGRLRKLGVSSPLLSFSVP